MRKVLPVIHTVSVPQSMRNAELAFDCGADGVFVIQMDGLDDDLELIATHLKCRWPDKFIGVNFLSYPAHMALSRALKIELDATWTDSPGVSSKGASAAALELKSTLAEHPAHLFFGSVAFKYQKEDQHPGLAVQYASELGMIPTTSGAATGQAPDIEKLKAIRSVYPAGPLALASGLTPENVGELGGYLSHMLVATGVSEDFNNLEEKKLRAFVDAVRRLP